MNEGKSSKLFMLIAMLMVVIGVGAASYVLIKGGKTDDTKAATQTDMSPRTNPRPDLKNPDPLLPTITFTDSGFSQSTYTFPAGMEIRVHNQSKNTDMEFSSDNHPVHTDHPELNMDLLKPGEAGTFKPAGKGTYKFHDHLHDQYTGTLIIQ